MSNPNQPDVSTAPGADTRAHADITDLVRAFYEPFRTGDTSIYSEILADDWIDIPLAPGQEQGPSGMAAQIAAFRQAMPDYNVTHEDLIAGSDRVAVRNTVSGTHQGAFMGHEPTGRRIEMRTMDIHQVRDNRIVVTWHLEELRRPDGATRRPGRIARPGSLELDALNTPGHGLTARSSQTGPSGFGFGLAVVGHGFW